MITRIRLKSFKSFRELDLQLEPLSVLIGVNASGKSNLREAFRFLHAVGRGYSLVEILGEKWGEGGDLQWSGIRGGLNEVAFSGAESFEIEVAGAAAGEEGWNYAIAVSLSQVATSTYKGKEIKATTNVHFKRPAVLTESLRIGGRTVFQAAQGASYDTLDVVFSEVSDQQRMQLPSDHPVLFQISQTRLGRAVQEDIEPALRAFARLVTLEPHPDAIRRPSFPGAPLGNHGENLSTAMLTLFESDASLEGIFREFLQALTPMDVSGFSFRPDRAGRVELILNEGVDRELSLASASDGTVRFLALLATLMQERRILFLEEIETGLHPARLALLLDLLRQSVESHTNQVFATSHSPMLLSLMGNSALEHAYLAYRSEDTGESTIKRFRDIPDALEVLERQDLARLHASGWFEDVSAFAESDV